MSKLPSQTDLKFMQWIKSYGVAKLDMISVGTQWAAFNELVDSMFTGLALFFGFSDTKDLGEYRKQKIFEFGKKNFFALGPSRISGLNWSKICKK